ncbi:hypothetical protein RND71_013133 [Anisodus tanguticus]|uniref:Threonyl-tRNA synthetase n=1 Tax=Anisodus tanguticus TaxID=243964 RepID=A0AAE1VMD5_9SOLA|nr:hypothetical protein RND71_013133 [Anisodus tanguticus]
MALSLSSSSLPKSLITTFSCFPISTLFLLLYPSKNSKNKLLRYRNSFSTHVSVADEQTHDKIVLPTNESSDGLLRIRHTCAHVMAMAVQKLYPNAKVTIRPWIENGFYYDFDMEPLTDRDLKMIKKEMDRIISRNLPLVREEVSRDEAQNRIMAINEPYKIEVLESIQEEPITIYHIGHNAQKAGGNLYHIEIVMNGGIFVRDLLLKLQERLTKKAVELESVADAYWRGDVKKPMLQRIYGTAWENEDQLKAYLHFKEEAKRRDHRRIGQDLDLFSIQAGLSLINPFMRLMMMRLVEA